MRADGDDVHLQRAHQVRHITLVMRDHLIAPTVPVGLGLLELGLHQRLAPEKHFKDVIVDRALAPGNAIRFPPLQRGNDTFFWQHPILL